MVEVAITCNGNDPKSVFPTFILAASSAALGDTVALFFTPAGAQTLAKGELEKMSNVEGLPDVIDLYDGIRSLGAKIYVCELALAVEGMKEEDFREGVHLVGATTFMHEIRCATITFSF